MFTRTDLYFCTKIKDEKDVIKVAEIGDSEKLRVGDTLFAVGTPLGINYSGSVTKGILSGKNRLVEVSISNSNSSDWIMKVLQTDAAINPGNSGGPLANINGEVIGITSLKLVQEQIEGMGFAIPINDAKDRIDSLSKKILTIGITGVSIDEERAKQKNIPEGVGVVSVTEGSVAEKAGLKANDIITKFDGQKVTSVEDINKIKETKEAGDKVEVVVDRYNEEIKLTLEFK